MKTRSFSRVAFLAVLTVMAYACESTWKCLRSDKPIRITVYMPQVKYGNIEILVL